MKKNFKILENTFFIIGITLSILMNIFFFYLIYQQQTDKDEKYWPGGWCPDYAPLTFTYKYDLEYANKDCDFKSLKEQLEKTYLSCDSENKNEYYKLTLNFLSKTKCWNTWWKLKLKKFLLSQILQNTSWETVNLNLSGNNLFFSGQVKHLK